MATTLASVLPYLTDALVILGLFALTVGVYGVIRMPDTYLKLHTSSAAVFLGVLPLLAAAAATGDPAIAYRAALVAALLLLTTPISAHAVTKAAYQRGEATHTTTPLASWGRTCPGRDAASGAPYHRDHSLGCLLLRCRPSSRGFFCAQPTRVSMARKG